MGYPDTTFYLTEMFRQAKSYLAAQFRYATLYLAELFRQIVNTKPFQSRLNSTRIKLNYFAKHLNSQCNVST